MAYEPNFYTPEKIIGFTDMLGNAVGVPANPRLAAYRR